MSTFQRSFLLACILIVGLLMPIIEVHAYKESSNDEVVILLHGIARTDRSMKKMEKRLKRAGYEVINIHYPSRKYNLQALTVWLDKALKKKNIQRYKTLHFVTHSMGSLLGRAYNHKYKPQNMGRFVMLGPPNNGSELADILHDNFLFKLFYGPAGQQLTTDYDLSIIVGKPTYEVGIIAGTKSLVPFSTKMIYKKANDGMVSVDGTRLEQATAHITMPVNHAVMMQDKAVMERVVHFLQQGKFH